MGFLSSVGNAIGSVVRPVTDVIGLTTPQGAMDKQSQYSARQNEIMQKQLEYQKKLAKEAQAFRDQLPQYKEESFRAQEDSAKRALANDLSGVRKSANRRGLLYSGLREGGEAEALGDFYANQSAQRSAINQQAEDTARGMEEKALGLGLQGQQQMQSMNDSIYDQALQQRLGRQSAMGGLFGAIGGLLGQKAAK